MDGDRKCQPYKHAARIRLYRAIYEFADLRKLLNGRYAFALDAKQRWQLTVMAATAVVDYIDGMDQPGRWHSGVGGGITYQSVSQVWKIGVNYGYGFEAIRDGDRGAHVVSLALQFDLEQYLNKRRSQPWPWELQ